MKNWMLVGCLLFATIGCNSSSTPAPQASLTELPANATQVSIKVPDMECPFACWPKVEKILAAQPGVEKVALAPQKDENVIDNPQVEVTLKEGFDLQAALKALDAGDFHNSSAVASK